MNELATSEKWERPGVGSRNPSSIGQRVVWEFLSRCSQCVVDMTISICIADNNDNHKQLLWSVKTFFFWRRNEQLEDRNSLKPLDVSVFLAYVEVFVSRSNTNGGLQHWLAVQADEDQLEPLAGCLLDIICWFTSSIYLNVWNHILPCA